MRRDYEHHFSSAPLSRPAEIPRSLDVSLAVLTSLACFFFLFALAVLIHVKRWNTWPSTYSPGYLFDVSDAGVAAIAGVCFLGDRLCWLCTTTPVPSYLGGIAANAPAHRGALLRPSSLCVRVKQPPGKSFQSSRKREALCCWGRSHNSDPQNRLWIS